MAVITRSASITHHRVAPVENTEPLWAQSPSHCLHRIKRCLRLSLAASKATGGAAAARCVQPGFAVYYSASSHAHVHPHLHLLRLRLRLRLVSLMVVDVATYTAHGRRVVVRTRVRNRSVVLADTQLAGIGPAPCVYRSSGVISVAVHQTTVHRCTSIIKPTLSVSMAIAQRLPMALPLPPVPRRL